MKLTLLLAFAALIISGTAAYFSIVGLAAIFAASVIPIIIMGSAVEIGKIITVAWLHFDWYNISKRLRYLLSVPVLAVMLITSVGVFGFLSKAHVAQTAASEESVAQVERIVKEVTRLETVIDRAEIKVSELELGTFKVDNATQEQIDKEQARIDSAYDRIQPGIDEQNAIISGQTKLFEDQIVSLDAELAKLQGYIDAGEIKKAQQLIGEKSKGGWGPLTTETANKWRAERNTRKDVLLNKIEEATQNNSTIVAARKEIQRLRANADTTISDSNALINRLRDKIANSQKADNTDELLDQQYARINKANADIETLTDQKYTLEAEYRQLEAEVGPIKYIAEFVYQEEADADLLERAVKWLIVLLLLCLDPFAILLVMAATDRYRLTVKEKKVKADPDGSLAIVIEKLEQDVAEAKQEADSNLKVIAIRNTEMNELREETQELIDEANAVLEKGQVLDEDLVLKLENAERERDDLQLDLTQMGFDLEIVQKEVEKVPALEKEIGELKGKISDTPETPINIQDNSGEASVLREHLASVTKLYNNLKEKVEKGK